MVHSTSDGSVYCDLPVRTDRTDRDAYTLGPDSHNVLVHGGRGITAVRSIFIPGVEKVKPTLF